MAALASPGATSTPKETVRAYFRAAKTLKKDFKPAVQDAHRGSMEILVFLLVVVWKSDFRTTPPGFVLSVLARAFS